MPLVKDKFKQHLTNRCLKNIICCVTVHSFPLISEVHTKNNYHKQSTVHKLIILDKNYTCNIQKYHKEINSG